MTNRWIQPPLPSSGSPIHKFPLFRTGDISTRRLKLWEESFEELLNDPLGRDTLQKFLDKEYSGENLRFWMEVN